MTLDSFGAVSFAAGQESSGGEGGEGPVKIWDLKEFDVFGGIPFLPPPDKDKKAPARPIGTIGTITTTSPCFVLRSAPGDGLIEVSPVSQHCCPLPVLSRDMPPCCSVSCRTMGQLMKGSAKLSGRLHSIRKIRRHEEERTIRIMSRVLRLLARQIPEKGSVIQELDARLQASPPGLDSGK